MPIAVYGTPVASQSSRTRSSVPARMATTARAADSPNSALERVEVEGQRDPCVSAVPQHAVHRRLREPAVGYVLGPIERPFGGRADEDVGQLPLGLEVAHLREPAEWQCSTVRPSAVSKPLTIMG